MKNTTKKFDKHTSKNSHILDKISLHFDDIISLFHSLFHSLVQLLLSVNSSHLILFSGVAARMPAASKLTIYDDTMMLPDVSEMNAMDPKHFPTRLGTHWQPEPGPAWHRDWQACDWQA